jgi:hypothetical protein
MAESLDWLELDSAELDSAELDSAELDSAELDSAKGSAGGEEAEEGVRGETDGARSE